MEFKYRYGNEEHTIRLEPRPNGSYLAHIDDRALTVEAQRSESGQINLRIGGERLHAYTASCEICKSGMSLRYVALVDREASVYELERVRDAGRRRAGASGGGSLEAQMPGQVMEVLAQEGDHVEAGQPLVILEAMKMEIRVAAPHAGTLTRLFVRPGETVERGQQLAEVEPA